MKPFENAARLLTGLSLDDESAANAAKLLERLGFDPPAQRDSFLAAVFGAAARMARIFEIRSPYAAGLCCVGGTVDPSSYGQPELDFPPADVSGRGRDMPQAFVSCVNEGVEYLAQLTFPDQQTADVSRAACLASLPSGVAAVVEELLAQAGPGRADALPAVAMRSLTGEADALLPLALCYRNSRDAGENLVSRLGCAAARTFEDACLSAILELIERDAAALWWLGGRPPRAVSAEVVASSGLAELTAMLRGGETRRRTCLFDITTDLGVPCAAAWSTDPEGGDFACGLAARPDLGEAACAAMLELCQMEVAHHLVREKLRHGGDQALTPVDRRHKARFETIHPEACGPLFTARPPARYECPSEFGHSPLDRVVRRLRERGVACFSLDLTRPEIGIPCARAFAPQLQPLPAAWTTARMRAAIDASGGATPYTSGVDLL